MRALVFLVFAVPLAAQQAVSPFAALKARTLLREQLPCLGCHELDGDGGRNAPSLTTVGQRRSDTAALWAGYPPLSYVTP